MATIPASQIVNINANVLDAGGSLVTLNSVFITDNTTFPVNTLVSFATADDVATYAGSTSTDYKMAVRYFAGYSISTTKPGRLYFYRIGISPTAGVLRSNILAYTLAELQAITPGTLTVVTDGVTKTSASIDLSTATSFTNAASLIQAAFTTPNFAVAYDSAGDQFTFTSNSTGATSTVTFANGTNGIDDALKLTALSGASLIEGTAGIGNDVSPAMNALTAITQNWFTFVTTYEATLIHKKSFSDWVSTHNAEYAYVCWDTTATAVVVNDANDNIENYVKSHDIDNVVIITKDPTVTEDLNLVAAFVCGSAASIDFTAVNNRPTFAFKKQSGLAPSVMSATIAQNIIDNGANFYGRYGTKNEDFTWLYPGQVSGKWKWFDELTNATYMKATMQNTLLTLLGNVPSIPYNQQGYKGLIATSLLGDIASFINYGAIRIGVTLSAQQVASVNFQAGRDISTDLFNHGYVLDVLDPGAIVRGDRGSPIINLWYTSGGAVQKINMTTTLLQ